MTIHEAGQRLLFRLYDIYDEHEAQSITDWVMEDITGWKKIDRILNKKVKLSDPKLVRLQEITDQLMSHKPVHYILQHAWFMGMKLYVNENVLIPRPETEELVSWVMEEIRNGQITGAETLKIMDVGTGSGCIPVALKKKLPTAEVSGCDISAGALEVAELNAREHEVAVRFFIMDFLDPQSWKMLPAADIIVSNPPYIASKERSEIDKHVLEFEPHQALFVPDDDTLVFYEQLARFGGTHLIAGGFMMMEIHYQKGEAVKKLFAEHGYQVELRQDLQGKDRMVKAFRQ